MIEILSRFMLKEDRLNSDQISMPFLGTKGLFFEGHL